MADQNQTTEYMVIVHIKEGDPYPDYLVCGDGRVRLFIVDENAPNDRVYEITSRVPKSVVAEVLGDSPRGHACDSRHAAIKHRVEQALEGKPHLEVIERAPESPTTAPTP